MSNKSGLLIVLDLYVYMYFHHQFSTVVFFYQPAFVLVIAKPHWLQTMTATALSIEENLFWECKASGKPKPSYSWLKNGEILMSEVKCN